MIKALRRPAIFRLWLGQAFSSIGDQIYLVGLTWYAVGIMGENTGYLAAAETGALMAMSFIGGRWADRWHPLRTMIWVDLLRAGIVLVPVVVHFFTPTVSLWVLWGMAISLSMISAFFDPAAQMVIPLLAKDSEVLQATNGLMSTTFRMARMVGPAIVGLLSGLIPMVHFFTVDAFTFLGSVVAVRSLRKEIDENLPIESVEQQSGFLEKIFSDLRAVRKTPQWSYFMFAKGITGGTWALVFGLGFALLVHEMPGSDMKTFGMVMASYGLGNFSGALLFGNMKRRNLEVMMFSAYLWMGVCFIAISFITSIPLLMSVSALSAIAGPGNDLPFIDMAQRDFAVKDLGKLFRLRMAVESGCILLCMLASPLLFRLCGVRPVIAGCGVAWILCGLGGLFTRRSPK